MVLNDSDFTLPEWKEVSKYDSSISTFVRLFNKGSSKIIMLPVISRILEVCDFGLSWYAQVLDRTCSRTVKTVTPVIKSPYF